MIHDVSTDPADPPQFAALLDTRRACTNGSHYSGLNADQHGRRYPHLVTATYPLTADKVFDTALAFAQSLGWNIASADKPEGRIEATATTRLLRFRDDVVIRIRATARGTLLDVRSASRVGRSDLGANARRITQFLGLINSVLKSNT